MSTRPKILIAEPDRFSTQAIADLETFSDVVVCETAQSDVRQALCDYNAIWIRLGLQIRESDLQDGLRCRHILSATTGEDHVDLDACRSHGIKLVSLKSHRDFLETITSTADLGFGLLLSLVRQLPAATESVKSGVWDRDQFRGRELRGMVLGLVGCGRLGRRMACYARAFDMIVHAYDPYVAEFPEGVCAESDLSVLLAQSDVVSLHVPLNEETERMAGHDFFGAMKSGATFLNTSRGAIVDNDELWRHFLPGGCRGRGSMWLMESLR